MMTDSIPTVDGDELSSSSTPSLSSSLDPEECLSDMLGGLSFEGGTLKWQEEKDVEAEIGRHKNDTKLHGLVDPNCDSFPKLSTTIPETTSFNTPDRVVLAVHTAAENKDDSIFHNAHEPNPLSTRPKVAICNIPNRGKGLVATQLIPKGSCIFTEKAVLATQLPPSSGGEWPPSILACQSCFRSLEPLSTLANDLPYPELWPVLPLGQFEVMNKMIPSIEVEQYGRVKCKHCSSLFCSRQCHSDVNRDYGSCCYLTSIYKAQNCDETLCLNEAPVALAARLFCHVTAFFRRHQTLEGHFMQGLCGSAEDLTALQVGTLRPCCSDDDDTCGHPTYTLEPLYNYLIALLNVTTQEQKVLSLELLHTMASKMARNGFGIRTQSPFKQYYAGLLRKTGRASIEHERHMGQIANALGGRSQLERGMDREIEDLVSPSISAIFRLTSHLNHSCGDVPMHWC